MMFDEVNKKLFLETSIPVFIDYEKDLQHLFTIY